MPPIVFNGQEYASPDEMPPDVRWLYDMSTNMLADRDQDGTPDLLQNLPGGDTSSVLATSQFIVDGKAYSSLDELPAEAQQRFKQAMDQFAGFQQGQLDSGTPQAGAANPHSGTSQPQIGPQVEVIGDSRPLSPALRWLLLGLALGLLVAGGLYLLFTGGL